MVSQHEKDSWADRIERIVKHFMFMIHIYYLSIPRFWELNESDVAHVCSTPKREIPWTCCNFTLQFGSGAASKTKLPDEWLSRGRGCWSTRVPMCPGMFAYFRKMLQGWTLGTQVYGGICIASGSSGTVRSFREVEFSAFLGHGYTVGGFSVVCQRPSKWARGRVVYSCLIF